MIKLKINREELNALWLFTSTTHGHIGDEIEKLKYKKTTFELVQFKVQLEEIKNFMFKIEITKLRKAHLFMHKRFTFSITPIQSLLILTYLETFKAYTKSHQYQHFVLNEQKDIIYKELLTK